jgi:UDP-3-O-[3-hydroxymyristoyl] glucosamine N-acyltransferase
MASEIANFLGQELHGKDFLVAGPEAMTTARFRGRARPGAPKRDVLLLTSSNGVTPDCKAYILSDRPDVDLAYVLLEFFAIAPINGIHPTALIDKEATIGRNVMIGPHSIVGPDVEIGDSTTIQSRVTLRGRVKIGKDCLIKDGAVVGSEGYGFVSHRGGRPIHPPHLGSILVGDRVWIGCNSTIEQAMTGETVIEDDAKLDDLVHVGGGTFIGRRSMITAGAVVAHSVFIGQGVTIAPNAVIREGLQIADGVTVGQGAVVVSDLSSAGGVYVGNAAKLMRKELR